jgi:hypothetical protein
MKSKLWRHFHLAVRAVLLLAIFTLPALGQNNPVPFINQPLVPEAVVPGGSAFMLTVNGTGFGAGSVVNWNGSARTTTFVSGSQVTAAISAGDIATAGTAVITVVNPTPGGDLERGLLSHHQLYDVSDDERGFVSRDGR